MVSFGVRNESLTSECLANERMKRLLILSVIFNIVLLLAVIYIGWDKTDYFKRVHSRLTHTPYVPERTDGCCVDSWNNCIEKMDMQVDIVFFGDSHIAGGDFQKVFPDVKSINLGYIGEDTKGMLRRVEAIAAVQPKKVFLMGGINGLKHQSLEDFAYWYVALVDAIQTAVPSAELYVHTLLPVTAYSYYCDNAKIAEANMILSKIVTERNLILIDLHSIYTKNSVLPDSMSFDGLHLTKNAYDKWYSNLDKYIY